MQTPTLCVSKNWKFFSSVQNMIWIFPKCNSFFLCPSPSHIKDFMKILSLLLNKCQIHQWDSWKFENFLYPEYDQIFHNIESFLSLVRPYPHIIFRKISLLLLKLTRTETHKQTNKCKQKHILLMEVTCECSNIQL